MFIDSHAHIDGPEFDKDRDEIIQRAHDAGVETIIVIGSGDTIDVAHRALTLAKTQNNLFATVGIHPHDAVSIKQPWWDEFEQLALDPKVVGIGETGLDYHYDHSPREIQQDVFAALSICHNDATNPSYAMSVMPMTMQSRFFANAMCLHKSSDSLFYRNTRTGHCLC